jgi:hypothetical protein
VGKSSPNPVITTTTGPTLSTVLRAGGYAWDGLYDILDCLYLFIIFVLLPLELLFYI